MSALMLEEETPNRAGFHKHRRNLLIVSWALFAGLWVGISFDNYSTLPVFGHIVDVQDPSRIAHVVWMMWLYFFIRYIACHIEITRGHQEEKFWAVLQQNLKNRYEHLAKIALEKASPKIKWHEAWQGLGQLKFTGGLSYNCRVRVRPGAESEEQIDVTIPAPSVWMVRLCEFNRTLFGRTLTSQYYLPYAIALAPVVLLIHYLF